MKSKWLLSEPKMYTTEVQAVFLQKKKEKKEKKKKEILFQLMI